MPERADVPFREVLELLESHGWVLQRIDPPYRVFVREGELPIYFPVHDKKVSAVYVDKIKAILKKGENQS